MSYVILNKAKEREVVGDAMPAEVLKYSTIRFDKKTNGWDVYFQNSRMYQRRGSDYYTRRVEITGSEEDLRAALQNIDFSNWIKWSSLTSLRAHYFAAYNKPTASSRQPRSADYVVDEDMTVRWNREQNALYNESIQTETVELSRAREEAIKQVYEEIACHMVYLSEGRMSLSQARALWGVIDETSMGYDDKLSLLDSMCEFWLSFGLTA